MEGKWEVVSNKTKKKGAGSNKLSKNERKRLLDNMPEANQRDPNQAAQMLDDRHGGRGDDSIYFAPVANKSSPKPHKAKSSSNGPTKHVSVRETLGSITGDSLTSMYARFTAAFPDQPSICMSDLAAHINRQFDVDSEKDPTYAQEIEQFPMCYLKSDAVRVLNGIINKLTKPVLSTFVSTAVTQMLQDNAKGLPTYGSRLLIQLILRAHPTIIPNNVHHYTDLMKLNRTHTTRFLMLAWCFNQASCVNFDVGCRVLMDLFMPYINVKTIGEYILTFAENLLQKGSKSSEALTYVDFIPMLDLVFFVPASSESTLPSNVPDPLMKRLKKIYPKFKEFSFVNQTPRNFKNYFPSLFLRLDTSGAQSDVNVELLSCLMHCLTKSSECFNVWTQMHAGAEKKTNVLLNHIVKNWKTYQSQLKKCPEFTAALKIFSISDENFGVGSVEEKIAANGRILLQSRPSKSVARSCFSFLFHVLFFILFTSILLVSCDLYQVRGVWPKTRTHRFLADTKLLPTVNLWITKAQPAYKYCSSSANVAWKKVSPMLIKVWESLLLLGANILAILRPYLDQAWAIMRPYLQDIWFRVEHYWPIAVEIAARYCNIALEACLSAATRFTNWITNLDWKYVEQTLVNWYLIIQQYAKLGYNRISAAVADMTASKA